MMIKTRIPKSLHNELERAKELLDRKQNGAKKRKKRITFKEAGNLIADVFRQQRMRIR